MDNRAFYNEREENKPTKLLCPSCRKDRSKLVKATSYMVRLDDLVACHKCRKRIELTGQSTVLINDSLGDRNADPENFGNR